MYSWSKFSIRRLFGLDKKTNVMDVQDGFSLDALNVYQDGLGRISKRKGTSVMFSSDESTAVDEIGTCTLSGTKYFFKFSNGDFYFSTTLSGATTVLDPSPTIGSNIWWAVLEDKLYFVDGTNALRYFDGSAILTSSIKVRPTAAPTVAGGAGTFTYVYTVDNGLGESPSSPPTGSKLSAQNVTVVAAQVDTGDKIRIYSRADSVAATSLNVTGTSGGSNVTYGSDALGNFSLVVDGAVNAVTATVAINDGQNQLYTERGEALNLSAPVGLEGIMVHYGRLVGWIGSDGVYLSKQYNSDAFPASEGIFYLPNLLKSADPITVCVSFLESLYVLQENGATVLGGGGPSDTGEYRFSDRRLEDNGNGCIAGKSAKVVENYLIYLSRNGFYATNGTDPMRIGEKIENEIQAQSVANLSTAVGFYHKRDGIYVCSLGADNLRITYSLDVRKDNEVLVGWFSWSSLQIKSVFYDGDRYVAGLYNGLCVSEEISSGSTQFSDATVDFFNDTNVDTATDIITVGSVYETGEAVKFRTIATPPSPLVSGVTYFAIYVSDTEIRVASTEALALAGTFLDITTAGSGAFSFIYQQAFEAFYSTNWFNFKHPSYVKKLGKLGLLFDVSATNISIDVYAAYDWSNLFTFEKSVVISSTHVWGGGLWGSFTWGSGTIGTPKNVAISRRKCRAVRYKFVNSSADSDFNLLGLEQNFDVMRNRGNFA